MIVGVIPARMGSTRFPGKPLAKIHDIPMIGHVYFRSKLCEILDEVYIATCDDEIKDYCNSISAKCIMTSDKHERASDRTAEAVITIENDTTEKVDIVVMIQGDEPLILPDMIKSAIEPMISDKEILVTNLYAELQTIEEFEDPNEVKVVIDQDGFALYFSREPIPSRKKGVNDVDMFKQVCVIPFQRDFLFKYLDLKPTPLEIAESVDMNRIIEHGYKVKMVRSDHNTLAVDTEKDLEEVSKLFEKDSFIKLYSNRVGDLIG